MATQVAKVIEIFASSPKGIEDAVEKGLKKAAQTVNNIRGAWVNEIKVVTSPDGKVSEWRVNLKLTFIVE
ncbi:MAG: dodecin family protein [Pseudoxanthomonas sp.]|nr:dodecin domain-containing protein [Xanthomonadales bacterium]MDZ3823692.1 dodecin family protein [Pseudoxanthomonas sp.]